MDFISLSAVGRGSFALLPLQMCMNMLSIRNKPFSEQMNIGFEKYSFTVECLCETAFITLIYLAYSELL